MAKSHVHFTTAFPRDPKIEPLSDAAFRCLVEAICWSRENQTDGFLPARVALAKRSAKQLAELSANHPTRPSLIEREDGWQIRDFEQYQDTKAQVQARTEHAKLAGQLGGIARAKQSAKQRAKQRAKQPAKQSAKQSASTRARAHTTLTGGVVGVPPGATPNGAVRHTNNVPDNGMDAYTAAASDPRLDVPGVREILDQLRVDLANDNQTEPTLATELDDPWR